MIINTSSTAALETNAFIPIYSATKAAVLALTRNFGAAVHYERNKVKIIAICPGVTDTLLLREMINKTLSNEYKTVLVEALQARAKQQIQKFAARVDVVYGVKLNFYVLGPNRWRNV